MAEDSLSVHSSMTFCLISFINSMKAFKGFFMWGTLFVDDDDDDEEVNKGDLELPLGEVTNSDL